MRANRRSFLRMLAGGAAWLAGGTARAQAARNRWDVHRATRNTLLGAMGALLPTFKGRPPVFKAYPGRTRIALPALVASSGGSLSEVVRQWPTVVETSADRLTLPELGRLLHLSNGVTTLPRPGGLRSARRAAPSAGALYSGEIYVAAMHIDGLASGIYYYAVTDHALVEVAGEAALGHVARAVEEPAQIAGAAAAILLTNVFERYTYRYANRGYRYALIDSGHIGENLRLAAASAGMRQRYFSAFQDDLLNDLLEIDGVEEALCALHVVGGRSESRMAGKKLARATLVEVQDVSPPGFTDAPVIQRYHSATKLVAGTENSSQSSVSPRVVSPLPRPTIWLPRSDPGPAMRVEDAIRVRRSTRDFLADSMSLDDFGYVLEMAQGHPSLERCTGIELQLAVHRVSGLAPGLYRYRPTDHRLQVLREGPLADDLVRVCLRQKKAGSAAAAFLMVADLGPGHAHASSRRYRDLLLESGAIGQRTYLAAEACGHSARNLAAFVDDSLNWLLGLDREREAVVHLTLVGPGD